MWYRQKWSWVPDQSRNSWGVADLFGRRSSAFEQKLEQAKDASLEKLKGKAVMLGASAIIGIDIHYMEIGANMLMVVANGTAVKLSEP